MAAKKPGRKRPQKKARAGRGQKKIRPASLADAQEEITHEGKQVDQVLRESERRLNAFLNNSGIIAWMKDQEGRYVFLSENFEKHFHVQLKNWQGKTDYELWPPATAEEFRRNDLKVLETGQAIETVEEATNPDGSRMYGQVHKFLYRAGSGELYIGGLAIDITKQRQVEQALKESEERMRLILNTASDAIISINWEGIIQSINPAAERMFGYFASEMLGKNVKMVMPLPYREEHDDYLARYLQTGERHIIGIRREAEGRRKDGSIFPVELAVNEVEHLKLFTGIVRDITRRKDLEREVVEISSLEQRRIGQDLHDTVGQELTALHMLGSAMADTLKSHPQEALPLVEKMIEGLKRSQQGLRSVLRGLLPVSVDQEGLMAALADLAERINLDGKVACTFACAGPVTVADNLVATHLFYIAQEAVRNAIKHGKTQTVRISLHKGETELVLKIQDNGIGMPVQMANLGLGLRIMRNRAAIIGANLAITSAQPRGTVVTCILPA